jgi:RNA-directed DNA polymerase
MVNGPQDGTLLWEAIDWRLHEENVRRLRQRIFKAAQDGSLATVRDLQKLMLRSWSNTLVSVRQATQLNAGRKTAGIDGEVALTPRDRMELAVQVHRDASAWRPRPVRRVFIPKAGNRAKLRPLRTEDKARKTGNLLGGHARLHPAVWHQRCRLFGGRQSGTRVGGSPVARG